MRKGAGISALSRHTTTSTSYSALSTTITTNQLQNLQSSLETFRTTLQSFASKHRADIRKDPAFRHQFQKMCAAIGVDPLSGTGSGSGGSTSKAGGWWQEILGLGEWQYELAVQVVDVCVSTRELNGGLIEMSELIARIERLRGGPSTTSSKGIDKISTISSEDVIRSLDLLKPLQAGYTILKTPHSTYIRSIPRELDTDQSTLLALAADSGGKLSERSIKQQTGWSDERIRVVLDDCVMREGLGWVDDQVSHGLGREVWLIAAVDFGEV